MPTAEAPAPLAPLIAAWRRDRHAHSEGFQHSPHSDRDDDALATGAAFLAGIVAAELPA